METTLGFEHIERLRAAFLAGTAHGELHHHDGQAQNDQEDQIEQHERAAAVFAGDIGETPHVSKADGAACGHQNEAQAGREVLALLLPACRLHGFRFSHCGYSLHDERG